MIRLFVDGKFVREDEIKTSGGEASLELHTVGFEAKTVDVHKVEWKECPPDCKECADEQTNDSH